MISLSHPARYRLTWLCFLLMAGSGFWLEQYQHEMFYSKLLIIGSLGLWFWTMTRPMRWLHLATVGLTCALITYNAYHFRHQHLVPLGPGVYSLVNE